MRPKTGRNRNWKNCPNLEEKNKLQIQEAWWESQCLCRLIRSPGPSRRRKWSWALKEKRDKLFFYIPCLSFIRLFFFLKLWVISCNNLFLLRLTFFKPRANDYTTKQFILHKGMFFLKFCTNDYKTTILSCSRTYFSFLTRTF